jgi:crossover junction endodeoxyribonuclease RusA
MRSIILPWPPTVNTYLTIARGRKILSQRGRMYKQRCMAEMLVQKIHKEQQFNGKRYAVSIRAYPPDKRKRDLDNYLKAPLDALVEYGAITDDSLIDDLRIQRFNPHKEGRLEIQIS